MWLDTIRFAETLEVLSLHPVEQPGASGTFHGFPVLGSVSVVEVTTKSRLTAAVVEGLLEPVTAADCFIPRHGVRAGRLGAAVELVICFECNRARVYPEGWTTISDRPSALIAQVLRAAGVPLSPV
jgi:hypothetical protein